MLLTAFCKKRCLKAPGWDKPKMHRALLYFLLLAGGLPFSLHSSAQTISLEVHEVSLESLFQRIQQQTNYRFVYANEDLTPTKKVTVSVKNMAVESLLETVFRDQPLKYELRGKMVIVSGNPKTKTNSTGQIDVSGKIVDEQGMAVAGVNVSLDERSTLTATDEKGNFSLHGIAPMATLYITSVGFEHLRIPLRGRTMLTIQLIRSVNTLDETVVKGYYSTTRRLNTGNISSVSATTIAQQPVSNPLGALEGRVPGLIVSQSSGVPGSSYKIQIRGQNSLSQGSDPYIIIDGVPFAPGNSNINQVGAAFSYNDNGLSPFNSINPNDIESIEVLKDADATAIYGSKGANGVVLITTKKGKAGQPTARFTVYHGIGKVARNVSMLDTKQYVNMRMEAYRNDGITPPVSDANDILVWDTTRYTNWNKVLLGGTAQTTDAQASMSGGSVNTQFLVSGNYHAETSVSPGDVSDKRGSVHMNLTQQSTDKKFLLSLTTTYSSEKNKNLAGDMASYIYSIPNLPDPYDQYGKLVFSKDGYAFDNPYANLLKTYAATIDNLLTNLQLKYNIGYGFSFHTNAGFNLLNVKENSLIPIASQNPDYQPTGMAQFGQKRSSSLIIEPQLDYQLSRGNSKLNIVFGGSWQNNGVNGSYLLANGYTNDALLQSQGAAAGYYPSTTDSRYKYAAGYLRAGYNFKNRYVLNLTGRRDGSSRFGPGKRYANFGAIGAAWIFTNESFIQPGNILSFGKLRGSYGTAGNDAIGDYKYLETYGSSSTPYMGSGGLVPTGLFNPDYNWEINKKFEAAIELGFLKDRLLFNLAYFNNRSSNQLVSYALPGQTGFSSITKNFPAVIQNTGIEMEISSTNFSTANFSWKTALMLSIPKNKLVSYPGIETSSYRNTYVVGKPLHIGSGFNVLGVDPNTGIYAFSTAKGDATSMPMYPDDYVKGLVSLDPKYTGSLSNAFNYKGFELVVFFEFRKQMGYSYLQDANQVPGIYYNQPSLVLNRWQHPGDVTNIQRYTADFNGDAYNAASLIASYGASNQFTDASFVRFKTLSLSYSFKKSVNNKWPGCRVFLQAQNLLTITHYKGNDPESQFFYHLPPLRTIVAGVQLTL